MATINDFLKSQDIACGMVTENPSTVFWSYSLPQCRCLGWISIYDLDNEPIIAASINFGLIQNAESASTLLEANSYLVNGLYYATQMNHLATVGFNAQTGSIMPADLFGRLISLHEAGVEAVRQFVMTGKLDSIPPHWV